jgi:cell division septum initiation protein DivIVA
MDLQMHYSKIRQEEQRIAEDFPVISSHESADGGKAGVLVEVTRRIAARFITLGLARIANAEEKKIFQDAKAEAKRVADDALETAKQVAAGFAIRGIEKLQAGLGPKE